ncbi:MAG TPA: DegV family protein [Deinococcales bacterium]|nr:DegV family protein [Deinococcales bacterium]
MQNEGKKQRVALVTDSTSDITPELVSRTGVTVVPLSVNIGNEVLKDRIDITTDELFRRIAGGAGMPSTSQPSPADFEAVYQKLLETHDHVLSMHIASRLSGTAQSATLAAKTFPGKVTAFDSHLATGGLTLMVERAARMLESGSSLQDVLRALEVVKAKGTIRFTVGTLEYLKKNGRIGGARALLGGILNVKPLLTFEKNELTPGGRPRGNARALAETVEAVRQYVAANGPSRAIYIYTSDPAGVQPLREQAAALGVQEVAVLQTGTVIAAHIGPDAYGICLEPSEV